MKFPSSASSVLQTVSLILALTFSAPTLAQTQEVKTVSPAVEMMSIEQAREENAYAVGLLAYLWGFPLQYYSNRLRRALAPADPINDFRRFTELKTAKDKFVATPNNVTIDAYASLDLTAEPVVIFVPALPEPRWYIVQIGDSFDEIIRNIGGTKRPQSGVYVVSGPDFFGRVPGEIKSRTKIGLTSVRILANGAADLPKAVEAQKGFHLMPLSAYLRYGVAYKPPPERPAMAEYESEAPEDIRFFDELGYAMNKRLPVSADSDDELVASFPQIGLSAGKGLEWQTLDQATKRGLARAAKVGPQIVDSKWAAAGETTNGWKYTFAGGRHSERSSSRDEQLAANTCRKLQSNYALLWTGNVRP